MLDVLAALMSGAMLNGFSAAVGNRDEVHADVLVAHALVREEFGDIGLEEGLDRIRSQPGHRLRHLVAWFDGPRLVYMSEANEYREAFAALNRAALKAQAEPTLDHLGAWLFAHARYRRAQEKFPLSKPAEPVRRNPRHKAAVALAPEDFDAEARAAIVALAEGDAAAGRRTLAALIARGADPAGHLAAILCKVDDGHLEHLRVLARKIAGQGGTDKRVPNTTRVVRLKPVTTPVAASPRPQAAPPPPAGEAIVADDAASAAAVETLKAWVARAWEWIAPHFAREGDLWLFSGEIRNKAASDAYQVAGRSAPFQALMRERLGPPA